MPQRPRVCANTAGQTEELEMFLPLAKPWIILVWCWWRAAGAAVHCPLSVLQRHEGGRMLCSLGLSCESLAAPRFILPQPRCLRLCSESESPALLLSSSALFFHQLLIKARGLSSGFTALLHLLWLTRPVLLASRRTWINQIKTSVTTTDGHNSSK